MFINIYKYLQGFLNGDGLYINWCNGYNRYNSCRRDLRSFNIMDIPKMDSTGIFLHGNRISKYIFMQYD